MLFFQFNLVQVAPHTHHVPLAYICSRFVVATSINGFIVYSFPLKN